jgi:hypothetical protein
MIMLKKLFTIVAITLTTTALAQSNYEPPRTASGKPNLQGFWTNASLTTMQRSDNYKDIGLIIPAERLQELTTNHHQNVRQATDDNQVAGQLPDGKDLGRGRGYNAFWVAFLSPRKECSCAGQVSAAAGVMMDPRAGRWVSAA